MKKLIVRSDMTWYTYINSQKINSETSYYSNLPQTASSLTAGNDDNNFYILITAKKHSFTDTSGKYKLVACTI